MKEQEFAELELQVRLCPSGAVAVAMNVSAPATGDQDTVLPPHDVETETLLGEQGPGEMEGRNCEKDYCLSRLSCKL